MRYHRIVATTESNPSETAGHSAARVLSVKLLPPKVPSWYVSRPALEQRLDSAVSFRLTTIVAGAGYGKSTHAAARANANEWAWYTLDADDRSPLTLARGLTAALRRRALTLADAIIPGGGGGEESALAESLASALGYALEEGLDDDLVLVVDDLQELGRDAAGARVLDALLRYAPPQLHLVLCSRDEPPFSVSRLRGRGGVLDLHGSDLMFSRSDVGAWLAGRLGSDATDVAPALHDATGGWPAAVQLATEMLAGVSPAERHDVVHAVASRRGPLFAYLAEEVLAREPPAVKRLLQTLAQFDRVSPDLCEHLSIAGARESLEELARRGLVTELPTSAEDSYALHALVREFVRSAWPVPSAELRRLHRDAATCFESHGRFGEALRELAAVRDVTAIQRFLEAHSAELGDRGEMEEIVTAAEVIPNELRRFPGASAVAHAYTHRADFERAHEWLGNVESRGWFGFQKALIHIHRGEAREALAALLTVPAAEDSAMCVSFIAYQLLALGRIDEARRNAERAFAIARLPSCTEPIARAETHMLAAEIALIDGDSSAANVHVLRAIEGAEALGNVLASCSARTRLVNVRLDQGRFGEAVDEATTALEIAERIGVPIFQAWVLPARGEAHLGLGQLDEAMADFAAAALLDERLQSNAVAYPLVGMGDIHRERGEPAQARAAYERALAAAERSGGVADLSAARAGLARVLAEDDPDGAIRLAEDAVADAPAHMRVGALLALGWLTLRLGRRDRAREAAAEAVAESSRRGAPALLAESLELTGRAGDDVGSLEEAVALWRRLGNPLGEARALLALAEVGGDVSDADVAQANETLRRLGVRRSGIATGALAMLGVDRSVPLAIETLGRFAVLRGGKPVASREWQSKKARDLLKLLVSRRGQTATREFLIEALWPEEDPSKTSNRLSVALNVIRNVLDPDHAHDASYYVVSTADGVRLDIEHVIVDVESFLRRANEGLRLLRTGERTEAVRALEAAENAYRGDFLEEDRYEDWASNVRDEARATYVGVARTLAVEGREGIRYRLRILALDPYDEDAHLGLVRALSESGMHGEARRAFRRYVSRMNEIGVEPAPFPTH